MNSVEPDTKEAESNPKQTDSQENSSLDELKDTKDDSTDDKQE